MRLPCKKLIKFPVNSQEIVARIITHKILDCHFYAVVFCTGCTGGFCYFWTDLGELILRFQSLAAKLRWTDWLLASYLTNRYEGGKKSHLTQKCQTTS